ncbi:hypothetical protein E2542_SST08989 [Spatholobus suberectus]|nr:hypothetical protein E2542_SST08989 [Spatholobus suberectus]
MSRSFQGPLIDVRQPPSIGHEQLLPRKSERRETILRGEGGAGLRRRELSKTAAGTAVIDGTTVLSRGLTMVDASFSGGGAVVWIHGSRGVPGFVATEMQIWGWECGSQGFHAGVARW